MPKGQPSLKPRTPAVGEAHPCDLKYFVGNRPLQTRALISRQSRLYGPHKLNPMSTTTAPAASHTESPPSTGWVSRTVRHPVTRRVGRIVLRTYVTLLLLAVTVQAVVLFLLWKWPSYDWGTLVDRFVTSPAMAGLFAVLAAVIGAWSLHRQLTQTKRRAEDDAWWVQFEWVTDRIVSPDEDETEKAKKAKDRLPKSLAYNLMTALSKSARAGFQKAAVAGIFDHYRLGETPSPEEVGTETSDESRMDATEAESLRALLAELSSDTTSSENAHRLLSAYDYEDEVQKALRHRFGPAHSEPGRDFGADAIVDFGSYKLVMEVKQSVTNHHILERTGKRLRSVMDRVGAAGGVIVTAPPSLKSSDDTLTKDRIQELSKEGIHLIEWAPAEKSGALQNKIRAILPYVYH